MAHPFFWAKKSFLYAIGNTAAVCLTQDLPPETPVKVLLLGCGDPRNILFTLQASGDTPVPRFYDFTCNDIEPGVLARNVILYTLLIDNEVPSPTIWNIMYHMKLDASSYDILVKQCQKLVDHAASLSTWKNCPYGRILRMTTSHTLSELSRYWGLYISSKGWSQAKKKGLAQRIGDNKLGRGDYNLTGFRNAGPLFTFATKIVGEHYRQYWKTGVTQPTDTDNLPYINPTFAFSLSGGDGWPAHYGSDPLLSFHLAESLALMDKPETASVQSLSRAARQQFERWCNAFKSFVQKSPDALVIRLAVADALAFSRALHYCATTGNTHSGIFSSLWSSRELVLDAGEYGPEVLRRAPLSFNVIDTSNLMDHLGLLNLLVCTAPLLSRDPYSSLHTEALLPSSDDGTSGFTARACADVATLSLLLGLVPITYITDFTTVSNVHEVMTYRAQNTMGQREYSQHHQRLAWKIPYAGDGYALESIDSVHRALVFDPRQLPDLLLDVYIRMFRGEDALIQLQKGISETSAIEMSLTHYARESYAAFLKLVKGRVSTDWSAAMDHLYDLILRDKKLLMGMNNHQELCCQLHLYGVYTVDVLKDPIGIPIPGMNKAGSRLKKWRNVPPLVCVVLEVPRDSLKPLHNPEEVGTPHIQLEIYAGMSHSVYASLHGTFGTLIVDGENEAATAMIEEDPERWNGTTPLIVSCWVPAWTLTIDPSDIAIRLSLKSTPQSVRLIPKLGFALAIFGGNLEDDSHIHIFSDQPNVTNQLGKYAALSYEGWFAGGGPSDVHPPVAQLVQSGNDPYKVSTLMIKVNIQDEKAKKELTNGAQLSVDQVGPCTLRIKFTNFTKDVSYPYPIDGTKNRLRISRKNAYIEAIAPLSGHLDPGGYTLNLTPVFNQGGIVSSWNVHHLDVSRLPRIDHLKKAQFDRWFNSHVSFMFSDRERLIRTGTSGKRELLVELKDSLYSFFIGATGLQSEKCSVIGLTDPDQGGIYTVIFVQGLYLDLSAHTIVIDAFVMPLTQKILSDIFKPLQKVVGLMQIKTIGEEVIAWKRLLPAAVERCRTWKHNPNKCEYIKEKQIPLTTEFDKMPICSCGRGVGTEEFKKVAKWKEFTPYVTRAAFSPLFAVSYLDPLGAELSSMMSSVNLGGRAGAARPGPGPGAAKGKGVEKGKGKETERGKEKEEDLNTCAWCGKGPGEAQLLLCSRCHSVKYCSQSCQKSDWKLHKPHCG
ncbi:hypothetical protein AX16_003252 [Volvariella volvacea WC 439]|nr:hypothetical protein AX16_003252 [Volvariella volvacea WC 439]